MLKKYNFHILLHLIIFMWGFTGILGKLIHLDALYIVWYRIFIAILALFIFFKFRKFRHQIPNQKTLYLILFTGFVVAIHWITFYYSIQKSTASLGILCLSTATLHVSWLEPLINKRKFNPIELVLGILIIIGIYFIAFDFDLSLWLAVILGLISAFSAALFSVLNARLVKTVSSYTMTFYEMISALALVTLSIFWTNGMDFTEFKMVWSDFYWLLFLGVICTAFAFLATIEVVKRLGAFTVTLSINLEPVYTILLAIFMLHENKVLSQKFYLGAVFIVGIVILNALIKGYQSAKKDAALLKN